MTDSAYNILHNFEKPDKEFIKNKECLIMGCIHADLNHSMYIDIVDKYMTIRCRHSDCFGKSYPVNHIIMNKFLQLLNSKIKML